MTKKATDSQQHEQNIQELAQRFRHVDPQRIRTLYESIRYDLERTARVRDYLTIMIYRATERSLAEEAS